MYDPNPKLSLEVFLNIVEKGGELTEDDLRRAKLCSLSDYDEPRSHSDRLFWYCSLYKAGWSIEDMLKFKKILKEINLDDVKTVMNNRNWSSDRVELLCL